MKRFLIPAAAAWLLALGLGAAAHADSPGLSRGDAEAFINARFTGNDAIRFQSGGMIEGAAAGGPDFGAARISPLAIFNGHHVCASSWHPVVVWFPTGGDSSFTREQAAAQLPFSAQYTLDGAPLATKLLPIKPVVDPSDSLNGSAVGYWNGAAALLSPDALATGLHTLSLETQFAGGTVDFAPVTFYVDAAGTGACL